MSGETNIAFVGNPNCGKTTLFNAYTGANLKVANWPGVTVEKKESIMSRHDGRFKLVDLPGTYSMTCYTMEEKLTRRYILEDDADVIIDVVDASALERNLYLTLQLIELGKPVVIALNMMDIVEKRGMEIDLHRMPEMLGVPVIPVSALRKRGLDVLIHAAAHHKDKGPEHKEHHHGDSVLHKKYVMVYSDDIENKIAMLESLLRKKHPDMVNLRWHAIKILEHDEEVIKRYPVDFSGIADESYETEIINQKYDFIQEIIEEVVVNKAKQSKTTDKVDFLMTNKYLGIPVFFVIMAVVFFLTFTIGDWVKGYFETFFDWFSSAAYDFFINIGAGNVLTSLISDGIIAGVGSILTFLPNIFILFLALAFLEDSGYMARVAYVMDGIMGKIGLSGRAFIPMLLGFGCSVPAIMATRTLEDPNDRLKTIMVTPFMSCSARLPIYVLFSEVFFGKNAMVAAYSMYVIGVVVAILVALVMNKAGKQTGENGLLIELPEYKTPGARTIAVYVWDKVKDYITRAGTIIFVASIIIWALLNFNFSGMAEDMSQSFAASIGKLLVPVLKPAGLGYWQVGVALISGIAAKEVVVSGMSVLYSIANISSQAGQAQLAAVLGASGFTALNAYCMMVFCLLYIPCVATIAAIRRETQSLKWTMASIVLQIGVAWTVSAVIYQVGSLLM